MCNLDKQVFLHQTDPEKMHYDALAQGVKHFKETEEGREDMCEAVEKMQKNMQKNTPQEKRLFPCKTLWGI